MLLRRLWVATAIVTCCYLCNLSLARAQAKGGDINAEIENLQLQVTELKAAFEDFKSTNTALGETLSQASTTIMPVGSITAFSGLINTIPDNWRLCDGKSVSKTDYPVLWDRIGAAWGGSGQASFNLPDLQGRFLRGVDGGTGRDPETATRTPNGKNEVSAVGSTQEDALQDHKHMDSGHLHQAPTKAEQIFAAGGNRAAAMELSPTGAGPGVTAVASANISAATPSDGDHVLKVATETRVKNAYVYWIIRVK